jgi:hypothetical protein
MSSRFENKSNCQRTIDNLNKNKLPRSGFVQLLIQLLKFHIITPQDLFYTAAHRDSVGVVSRKSSHVRLVLSGGFSI